MSRTEFKGPRLPQGLLGQIENGQQKLGNNTHWRSRTQDSRKERRKAQRNEKRQLQTQPRSPWKLAPNEQHSENLPGSVATRNTHLSAQSEARKPQKHQTDHIKRGSRSTVTAAVDVESPNDDPPKPSVSRAVKERLAADDAEIAALKKRLGIKGKTKKSKAFEEDGLDFLLDDQSDQDHDGKRKRREYDEYIQTKRRRRNDGREQDLSLEHDEAFESSGDTSGEPDGLDSDTDEHMDEDLQQSSYESDDDDDFETFDGFETADVPAERAAARSKENPYKAPVSDEQASVAKYVPPSMRQASDSDGEIKSRIRKQVQGLLNRLSEANVITVVHDVERLYQNNPRQYVSSALIDLLVASLAHQTRLNDTFIVLHAGFVAALYKVMGLEFGAQFIERIVGNFDRAYEMRFDDPDSKVAANLISLIATLYIFQVITAPLMFDYVRLFLDSISEFNTELLLLIVRSCGTQLRQDDPSSLKDIVAMLHSAVAETGESNLSVRTKFMIETVNNLKNNRAKAGATASAVVGEHITRMKKAIGTLPSRKATEPLRMSLADLRNAEKKGKWWLAGASWKGEELRGAAHNTANDVEASNVHAIDDELEDTDGETDLVSLAKDMGMNTEIRRAVFISIMSASDIKDAQLRLLKLRLKKTQEVEIPRVLIKCVGVEQTYNQYYTLIAQRLCSQNRRLQKAFQFGLWDLFRRMGENYDEGDDMDDHQDEEQAITARQVVNLGQMFGTLMEKGAMSVSALKILSFGALRSKTKAFLEVLFTTIFQNVVTQSKAGQRQGMILKIFEDAGQAPSILAGLPLFLEQLAEGDVLSMGKDSKLTRQCCYIAVDELRGLENANADEDF